MIRLAQWTTVVGGTEFRVTPLTVRQRLALSEELATERARAASDDAKLAGMSRTEAAEHIGEARRKSLNTTALYLESYSLRGAIRILTVAMGGAENAQEFSAKALPRELSRTCLEALGIDTDMLDAEDEAKSGNE